MMVTIDVVRDAFTDSQKRELIHRVTEAVVAVEGEPMRAITYVRINEFADNHCALAGRPLTALDMHRLAAERAGSPDAARPAAARPDLAQGESQS